MDLGLFEVDFGNKGGRDRLRVFDDGAAPLQAAAVAVRGKNRKGFQKIVKTHTQKIGSTGSNWVQRVRVDPTCLTIGLGGST